MHERFQQINPDESASSRRYFPAKLHTDIFKKLEFKTRDEKALWTAQHTRDLHDIYQNSPELTDLLTSDNKDDYQRGLEELMRRLDEMSHN